MPQLQELWITVDGERIPVRAKTQNGILWHLKELMIENSGSKFELTREDADRHLQSRELQRQQRGQHATAAEAEGQPAIGSQERPRHRRRRPAKPA